MSTDRRKQSFYFPEDMIEEIRSESVRLDRSMSWMVQQAWKRSRLEIQCIPSVQDVTNAPR